MWLLPPLLLLIVPGCFSISGPWSVTGSKGGSVTIPCHYDPGWETYWKWWCRGEAWGSCKILIETTGSEQKVVSNRVSIKDDHRSRVFTVTVEELRGSDEDTYWCGINKPGTDLGHQVHVFVGPELTSTYPAELTSIYPTKPVTAPVLTELASSPPIAQSSNSSIALTSSLTRFLLCNIHLMLLTSIKMLLLGGLLCIVMWLSRH